MRLRFVVVFICGLLFAPQVLAVDAVSCVQQYLTDAGYDVGGVDGAFGGKTAQGGEAFLASPEGAQYTLPVLSKTTVRIWCDILVPAERVPTEVLFKGDIKGDVRKSIEVGAKNADGFFTANFTNLIHRQPVTIYAGTDAEWMTDHYLEVSGLGQGFKPGKLESFRTCETPAEFAWYSLFLCTNHQNWSRNEYEQQGIVAHEIWHTFQADLVGDKARSCCTSDDQARKIYGPEWLKEGSATFMKHAMFQAIGVSNIEGDMDFLQSQIGGNVNLLDRNSRKGYRDSEGGRDVSENMGVIATYLLVKRSGFDALANFYRYLGSGLSEKDAFTAAFGLSMSDFEVEFIGHVELK